MFHCCAGCTQMNSMRKRSLNQNMTLLELVVKKIENSLVHIELCHCLKVSLSSRHAHPGQQKYQVSCQALKHGANRKRVVHDFQPQPPPPSPSKPQQDVIIASLHSESWCQLFRFQHRQHENAIENPTAPCIQHIHKVHAHSR